MPTLFHTPSSSIPARRTRITACVAVVLTLAIAFAGWVAIDAPAVAADKPPRLTVESGAKSSPSRLRRTYRHEAMYTTFEFTIYAPEGETDPFGIDQLAASAFESIDSLERRISIWQDTSQVSYINQHAAERPVKTDKDIVELIAFCKKLSEDTHGAFDPTVGPLLDLWGLYKEQGHQPSDAELEKALSLVGMNYVELDMEANTVHFTKPGVRLDFGGIGKGMALDQCAVRFRKYGITSALLVGGGSTLVAIGAPPDAAGWTVHVRDPRDLDKTIHDVTIADESLSTSGCYEPQMHLDGKSLCHIVDPRSGRPIEGMLSASAVGHTGMLTDGLGTAFMVLGDEGIRAYCHAHPDVSAVVIANRNPDEPEVELVNQPGQMGTKE